MKHIQALAYVDNKRWHFPIKGW